MTDHRGIDHWLDHVARIVSEAGDLKDAYGSATDCQCLHLKGKMFRPRLLLMVADSLGVLGEPAADLAAGIEMIHNASLLHDDVVDEATLRRGKAALHKTHGARYAIMAGDVCFAKAMTLICRTDHLAVYRTVSKSVVDLSTGQLSEWINHDQKDPSFDRYFSIVDKKTGSLIALCLELPGILANLPGESLAQLRKAGRLLGRAFQVADDMLDLDTDPKTGKDAFSDLAEGKLTYPYLLVLQGDDEAAALVRKALGHPEFPTSGLCKVMFANGLRQQVVIFLEDCLQQSRALLTPLFGEDCVAELFLFFERLAFRNR